MDRAATLEALKLCKAIATLRDGVVDLALFGSVAGNPALSDSDVDRLVRFNGPATSDRYFGVQFFREDPLGRPVDLVTDKALRPELRPSIDTEAVHV